MATGTWKWYRNGLSRFIQKEFDWTDGSFGISILQSDYTPSQDSDSSLLIISGTDATTPVALSSTAIVTASGGVVGLKAANASGSTAIDAGRYVVLYEAVNPYYLIGYLTLDGNVTGSTSWGLTLDQTNGFLTLNAD